MNNFLKLKDNRLVEKINLLVFKYFNFLVIFVILVILLVGYFFLLRPKYNQIEKTIEKNELLQSAQETDYNKQEKYLTKLNQLIQAFDESDVKEEDLKKMEAILPAGEGDYTETTELMAQLEALIAKNGLILTSLNITSGGEFNLSSRPSDKESGGEDKNNLSKKIKTMNISISVIGTDYLSFKNLLRSIEYNLRLIDIVSLNFSPSGGNTSLSMVAYYYDNPN